MSKVIRVKDDIYKNIEELAYKNRVSILEMSDILLRIGLEHRLSGDIKLQSRGRNIKIEW